MMPTTPEGDPDPLDPQAVGPHPAVDHLADRVGQARPPCAARRPWPPPGRRPAGAGRARWRRPRPARPGPRRRRWPPRIALGPLLEQVGGPVEGLVAGGRRGPGQQPAGRLGTSAQLGHRGWTGSIAPCQRTCRASGSRRPGPVAGLTSSTTRSSRWTTSEATSSGSSSDRRPAHRPPRADDWRTRPLAKTAPSGPAISTASSAAKPPAGGDAPRRAAGTAPARPGPGGPRRRPRWSPRSRRRRRSTACGPAAAGPGAGTGCPPRGRPGHRGQHPGAGGVGDDRLHPRPHGDLGRGQLRAHAAAAHRRAGAAGDPLELVVDLDHLLDERAGVGPAGVLGEQAGGVGQQHQQVGPDQMGDQGGQAVVVAETDLLVGHGVVLVDHRDHAQLEQPGRGSGGRGGTGCGGRSRAGPAAPGRRSGRAGRGRRSTPASAGAGPRRPPPGGWPGRRAGAGPGPGWSTRRRWPPRSPPPPGGRPAGLGHLGGQLVDGRRCPPGPSGWSPRTSRS